MKKIISYSLYGQKPKYLEGLKHNIDLLDEVFQDPSWKIRVYYDDSVPESKLIKHDRVEYNKVINDVNYMFWRFYAWDDPDVEVFLSRDLDDRLNFWDYNMVREWEKSNHDFFSGRCHFSHNIEILGGLWGGKPRNFSFSMVELVKKFQDKHDTTKYNDDQIFLADFVYPLVKEKTLSFGFYFGHGCADHINLPLDTGGLKTQTPIGNANNINEKLIITEHNITEACGVYEPHQKNWESKCSSSSGYHSEQSDAKYKFLKNNYSKIKEIKDLSHEAYLGIPKHLIRGNKFLFV